MDRQPRRWRQAARRIDRQRQTFRIAPGRRRRARTPRVLPSAEGVPRRSRFTKLRFSSARQERGQPRRRAQLSRFLRGRRLSADVQTAAVRASPAASRAAFADRPRRARPCAVGQARKRPSGWRGGGPCPRASAGRRFAQRQCVACSRIDAAPSRSPRPRGGRRRSRGIRGNDVDRDLVQATLARLGAEPVVEYRTRTRPP
jgi:hypothetical protein